MIYAGLYKGTTRLWGFRVHFGFLRFFGSDECYCCFDEGITTYYFVPLARAWKAEILKLRTFCRSQDGCNLDQQHSLATRPTQYRSPLQKYIYDLKIS